jgi:hypothetical protein
MPVKLADQLTDEALVTSLRSATCPSCTGVKKCRQTFCFKCWSGLSRSLRAALWAPLGKGYRESVLDAMQFLEVETFTWTPLTERKA